MIASHQTDTSLKMAYCKNNTLNRKFVSSHPEGYISLELELEHELELELELEIELEPELEPELPEVIYHLPNLNLTM